MYYCFSFKEVFEMGAQLATILAVGFAGWALWHSASATRLQRDAIQTSLFADIYRRITEIEGQRKNYSEENIGEWCVLILGHLEYFSCLVNNGYISMKLVELYRNMIIDYHDSVLINQGEVLKQYYKEQPETFSELRKLVMRLKKQ